ncbi:MAG: PepSY-like domain-containing protein [Pseudoflavonifractor sp.]|nr:PepSY-like domain-containing protein [Alloprevotella sp.]MCM1116984.1 PepSY-like domain-containing protein [Pseudoflavonifractor sp.]
MKKMILAAMAAIAVISAPAIEAQSVVPPQGALPLPTGVGPAVSGSVTTGRLPKKATDFLAKQFSTTAIVAVDEDFDDQTFEVDLADGTDVEFDSRGEWTEVDAGRGCLPAATVKALLPSRAYSELSRLGYTSAIETVKRSARYYKVELRSPDIDDLRFDRDGKLVGIEFD